MSATSTKNRESLPRKGQGTQEENTMKAMKILAIALALCLGLAACGGEAPTVTTEDTTPIVTTETPTEADNGLTTYTVTVQDENGTPLGGAMVQLCQEACIPGVANDQGVATFQVAEADYKVSFLKLPAGYTYSTEEQEFYFEDGSHDMIIVLKAEA